MDTNAITPSIALSLAQGRRGTFTGLIITKKGQTRGRGGSKKLYGNDTVHVTMVTGFNYEGLVARSKAELQDMISDKAAQIALRDEMNAKGITSKAGPITLEDVQVGMGELDNSFAKTLTAQSRSTTDHVYEPLVVDGETVRGCRVYKGNPNGDDAAKVGTIYLQGLKIQEKVLEPAPNGPIPPSNSAGRVVVKNYLRRRLPVGRYVSYALEQGGDYILNIGGSAVTKAEEVGATYDLPTVEKVLGYLGNE